MGDSAGTPKVIIEVSPMYLCHCVLKHCIHLLIYIAPLENLKMVTHSSIFICFAVCVTERVTHLWLPRPILS